jgi:hypothetical protein
VPQNAPIVFVVGAVSTGDPGNFIVFSYGG